MAQKADTRSLRIGSVSIFPFIPLQLNLKYCLTDELETLLLQKESAEPRGSTAQHSDATTDGNYSNQLGHGPKMVNSLHEYNSFSSGGSASPTESSTYQNGVGLTGSQRNNSHSPPQELYISTPTIASSRSSTGSSLGLDVIWPNWPPNLPGPELLRHL